MKNIAKDNPRVCQAFVGNLSACARTSFDLEIDDNVDIAPYGWRCLGSRLASSNRILTCSVLALGECTDLEHAALKLSEGNANLFLAPGYARDAFIARYPRHGGRPVVLGGTEWQDLAGDRRVVALGGYRDGRWSPSFAWSCGRFASCYLWLVYAKTSSQYVAKQRPQ